MFEDVKPGDKLYYTNDDGEDRYLPLIAVKGQYVYAGNRVFYLEDGRETNTYRRGQLWHSYEDYERDWRARIEQTRNELVKTLTPALSNATLEQLRQINEVLRVCK